MVAATACACDGGQPLNPVAYENYDIPKHISQGELQFYDTPRNLLNDVNTTSVPDSYGNYDTPQQPLPVYRKPCGCIMKLIKFNEDTETKPSTSQEQDQLLWAFVQTTPEVVHELSADAMPRVKLTGSGKMPVVDMRKSQISTGNQMASGQIASGQVASGQMASGQLASGHPTVSG